MWKLDRSHHRHRVSPCQQCHHSLSLTHAPSYPRPPRSRPPTATFWPHINLNDDWWPGCDGDAVLQSSRPCVRVSQCACTDCCEQVGGFPVKVIVSRAAMKIFIYFFPAAVYRLNNKLSCNRHLTGDNELAEPLLILQGTKVETESKHKMFYYIQMLLRVVVSSFFLLTLFCFVMFYLFACTLKWSSDFEGPVSEQLGKRQRPFLTLFSSCQRASSSASFGCTIMIPKNSVIMSHCVSTAWLLALRCQLLNVAASPRRDTCCATQPASPVRGRWRHHAFLEEVRSLFWLAVLLLGVVVVVWQGLVAIQPILTT